MAFLMRSGPRGFKLAPILLFAVFAAFYWFSNQETVPYTGRSQIVDMSREQEAALGLQSYRTLLSEAPVVRSGAELEMIRRVGHRIAEAAGMDEFQWEFNLIDSPEINAFCLPGGKVAVYRGILPVAQNEDGLAVVMGHEIAHAIARHGAERMAQEKLAQIGQLAVGMAASEMEMENRRLVLGAFGLGTQFGVLLPFSRTHESEADKIGLHLMAKACFNPSAAVPFWERMSQASKGGKPPEFVSTHPSDQTRIENLGMWLAEASAIYSDCSEK